jgi:type IV pilus assembly protein PilC
MAVFKYKAIDDLGEKIEGTCTANSLNEVLDMIRNNGNYPVSVEETNEKKRFKFLSELSKVPIKDLSIFCRQFYTMINAGASILNTVNVLRQQAEHKMLKAALNSIYEDVQKGLSLSESMEKHEAVFPQLLINMVRSGEISGNLDGIMKRMSEHYDRENKINTKVKAAMTYPIFLSMISIAIVIFMLIFVMPIFVGMFQSNGAELPGPTRFLLNISYGLKRYWLIVLIVIFILVIGFKIISKNKKVWMFMQTLKLRIPFVRDISKKVIVSRFARSLSTILSNGIPLVQALEVVAKVVCNKYVEVKILEAKDKVIRGASLADAIEDMKFFPIML